MDAPIVSDFVSSTTIAFKLQEDQTTYADPDTDDLIAVSNVSLRPNEITLDNPEYRGSIHRPGPLRIGSTWDLTVDTFLRGPGGVNPPAANAFIIGRMLQTLGFTENRVTAAIPAALEDLGVGSTELAAKLGASATGTADLYKGLALALPGADPVSAASLSMISAYSAAKLATLAEEFDDPPTGKYQIPKQIAYLLSAEDAPPVASAVVWLGGKRRELVGLAPSAATITFPTATRDGGSDLPKLSLTYSGDLHGYSDEACPAIDVSIPVPPFKGGKMMIAGKRMGGSSLSVEFAPRVGYRPNPNRSTGSEGGTLVETRRTLAMNLNQTTKAYLDLLALAEAQSEHDVQALYGYGTGNYVGFLAAGARFSTPEDQAGSDFYTQQINGYIDDPDKTVAISFPYWG